MSWKILSALLLVVACTPSNDKDDNPLIDTDDDDGGDDSVYTEQDFTLGNPSCSANVDGSWSTSEGYWTSSIIYAQKDTGTSSSETFSIQVDGDLSVGGIYVVESINFTEQEAQDTPVKYEATYEEVEGVTFTVQGFADDTFLFGVLNLNEVSLNSTSGTIDLYSASCTSWPKFGT